MDLASLGVKNSAATQVSKIAGPAGAGAQAAPFAQPEFNNVLNQAVQSQAALTNATSMLSSQINPAVAAHVSQLVSQDRPKRTRQVSSDGELVAQVLPDDLIDRPAPTDERFLPERIIPENVDAQGFRRARLSTTPFQLFMDKSFEFFKSVSALEAQTDALMEQYVEGKASLEDLMVAKAKVGVALTFSVTMMSQLSQAFNELKNMQV